MKIYVRGSESKNLPEEYVIDVIYNVPFDKSILASNSEINPIYLHDGTIDEQALADYDAFIDNIYACLSNRFEVVEIEESPRSVTSWYFWMYGKDADGNVATKILVRLRISDHEYAERHNRKAEHDYVKNRAQELKRPSSKREQDWKIKNIIINGEKYSTYEEAEDAIYDKMDRLSKELKNKG